MKILYKNSLAKTIDAVNEFLYLGKTIPSKEKAEVCNWIADRQGMQGSYARMFAPTDYDFKHSIRVFTGERVTSGAATGHILGEETCRVLRLLKSPRKNVKDALQRASTSMRRRLMESGRFQKSAIFCCGICTVSLWRNIAAGGLKLNRQYLKKSLKTFRKYRDGEGRWQSFPFYYTLLSLSEIGSKDAWTELQYAGRVIERLVTRQGSGKYGKRRKALMDSILKKL
ncbi:MAG: hypothetical protein WBB37_03950 [bacterium]